MADLIDMQNCNLQNLPENYQFKYFLYHAFSWPQMLHVSRDFNGNMKGYVMAKMDEEENSVDHGHVTSVSVLRSARKLGVATGLMKQSMRAAEDVFGGKYISLHVRCTNEAALALYHTNLGYKVHDIDKQYYGDKEDAYEMKKIFKADPYGASIERVSRSQKHDGLLKWPSANPEGKLKVDDYLKAEAEKRSKKPLTKSQQMRNERQAKGK